MADWFNRVRGDYQGAMYKPSQDWATSLATLLGANVTKPPAQATMFPIPSRPPDADLAQPTMAPATLPPRMVSEADVAQPTMAPPGLLTVQAPPVTVQANRPAPAAPPQAAAPAPENYADMVGYGGSPAVAQPDYRYLNPTPSLEEVFRREYAANPGAFGNHKRRVPGILES